MAKATILSSLGDGLYRVKLHFDNSRIETRLAHMATQIADYITELAELGPDKIEKTTTLNAALAALNNYINTTPPAVYVEDPTELNALTKTTWTARADLEVVAHNEKLLKLKKTTLEKETDLLNKLCPADFETNAWCVEYVEDLSGETQAIECDYLLWRDVADNQIEHDTGIWLPAATTPATNALIHPMASSEHATWFNLCMAPAAQRHAGRYRIATLNNLNKESSTCDVTFDGRYDVVKTNGNVIDNEPIHPQFAGSQQNHYSNANIVYGTCNGEAFENGDLVVVDLHNGVGAPTVIGFHDNPRQCMIPFTGGPYGFHEYLSGFVDNPLLFFREHQIATGTDHVSIVAGHQYRTVTITSMDDESSPFRPLSDIIVSGRHVIREVRTVFNASLTAEYISTGSLWINTQPTPTVTESGSVKIEVYLRVENAGRHKLFDGTYAYSRIGSVESTEVAITSSNLGFYQSTSPNFTDVLTIADSSLLYNYVRQWTDYFGATGGDSGSGTASVRFPQISIEGASMTGFSAPHDYPADSADMEETRAFTLTSRRVLTYD